MKDKEVVLFIPLAANAFYQQVAIASYLEFQSELRPHFLLITEKDHHLIPQLTDAGLSFSTLDALPENGGTSYGPMTKLVEEVSPDAIPNGRRPFKALRWWTNLSNRKRLTKKLIRTFTPRCAIVSEERPYLFLPVLKALHELKIPIILIPSGFDSTPVGNAWPRRQSHLLMSGLEDSGASPRSPKGLFGTAVLNRLVHHLLPDQIYDSRWGKMLFYPAKQTLLLKMRGMLPRNPWYQGTTFPDFIMISGQDEAKLYADAEVDSAKILLYGSHEFDKLYERWSNRQVLLNKLTETYQLDSGKPILVVTPPRLWEQNLTSIEVHWQSIKDILEVLSRSELNILISLHPHSDPALYAWIEEEYPVRICSERLTEILVVADIFVASYSSTLRWAIGLGIPSINLDLWNLNLDMYSSHPDLQAANTLSELENAVESLAERLNPETNSGGQTLNGGTNSILVDGRAKERLLSFIQSPAVGVGSSEIENKLPTTTGVN